MELAKVRLGDASLDEATRETTWWALVDALDTYLRLLHPVMPFVTEALWGSLPHRALDPKLLFVARWHGAGERDLDTERDMAAFLELVTELRNNSGKLAGGRGAARFRASLVTAQIALSMALLTSAGLFVKSLRNISRVDLGVNIDNMVTFGVSPPVESTWPFSAAELTVMALAGRLVSTASVGAAAASVAAAPVAAALCVDGGRQRQHRRENDRGEQKPSHRMFSFSMCPNVLKVGTLG